jgi:hypothetical protein
MLPQLNGVTQNKDYSTKQITGKLLSDVKAALENLQYGSVELYVVNGEVTQICTRHIKKTNTDKYRTNN